MKKTLLILNIMFVVAASSWSQEFQIQGNWLIKSGRILRNYEMAKNYNKNEIIFTKDSINLLSGFFYRIDNPEDDVAHGRYPFIFYGNSEKYKIVGDSLFIFYSPFKEWKTYRIDFKCNNEIHLSSKSTGEATLIRLAGDERKYQWPIRQIKVTVFGNNLFNVAHRFSITEGDSLFFDDSRSGKNYKFTLKKGTFNRITKGFSKLDLNSLPLKYPTEESEIETKIVEIELKKGVLRNIKVELENDDYPDELRFALIPVLFLYQQFLFWEIKPNEWWKNK